MTIYANSNSNLAISSDLALPLESILQRKKAVKF